MPVGTGVGVISALWVAVGGGTVALGDGVGSELPPLSEQAAARSAAAMMLIATNFKIAAMLVSSRWRRGLKTPTYELFSTRLV